MPGKTALRDEEAQHVFRNSRKVQKSLSSVLVLLTIGLYYLYYFHAYHWQGLVLPASPIDTPGNDSLFILNPEKHVYRPATTLRYVFNITSGVRYPDGVAKEVFLINDDFPGPTIEARSGDELVVEVINYLTTGGGVSIHYHGLTMRDANEMDGTTGVTQCAIGISKSFTYRFMIEESQSGTFWYHAHSDVQRADGLYGALIVHKPIESGGSDMSLHGYEEEQVLMVGDWYHRSAPVILDYYRDHTNFGVEPAPDSLLINGQGAFNCSNAVAARPLDCRYLHPPEFNLHNKRVRFRVMNVGALTGITLRISGHDSRLLTLDGGNAISPTENFDTIGILYPGERMDIISEIASNSVGTTPMLTIALDQENLKFPNFALTPVQHFRIVPYHQAEILQTRDVLQGPIRHFNLANAKGRIYSPDTIPSKADITFLLYANIAIMAEFENSPLGFINWTSWKFPSPSSIPLLAQDREQWTNEPYVLTASQGEAAQWVDIVLNNMDDKGHPFHLHGHDFYVLASHKALPGHYNAYNPFDSNAIPAGGPINIIDPPKKDSVFVPRMGYVVLRFRADNPGLWFFHCHVLWHQKVGMALAFQVGGDEYGVFRGSQERLTAMEMCEI